MFWWMVDSVTYKVYTPSGFYEQWTIGGGLPGQYALAVNTSGSGSVTLNPAGGFYNPNTSVQLTAVPSAGWSFSGWSGDLSGSTNPASITMNSNKTVTATFTQAPGQNLVGYWRFDETSGTTAVDSSTYGNNGTLNNATRTDSGKYGRALVFNGTNARVTIPNSASLQLTTAMTLMAWVNPSTVTSAWRDVIYKGSDNYYLEAMSTNSSRPAGGGTFGSTTVETYGTAALAANTWTHLAVTYGAGTLRLYVNGTQVSSLARTGNLLTSTNPLEIGGDSIWGQYFAGMIDEVRVYNLALTQAEIQAVMAGGPVARASAHADGQSVVGADSDFRRCSYRYSALSYQWQKQPFGGSFGDIVGATSTPTPRHLHYWRTTVHSSVRGFQPG